MFYLDPATGKRYYLGRAFTYGDINYTTAGATDATFRSLGFQQVIVGPRPDDRYYIISGPNNDGSWNVTPRDLQQLKDGFVSEQVATGQQLLLETDWAFTRDYETTTTGHENLFTTTNVPTDVQAYRQEVREVALARITAISTCATLDDLIALMSAPAEIEVRTPGDPDGAGGTMPNPAAYLRPWPTLDPKSLEGDMAATFLLPSKRRVLTPEDKLNLIGLTVDELKTLLGIKDKS